MGYISPTLSLIKQRSIKFDKHVFCLFIDNVMYLATEFLFDLTAFEDETVIHNIKQLFYQHVEKVEY